MFQVLTVIGFSLSVFYGFIMPKKAGWTLLFLVPLLGQTGFTIIPTSFIPLTFNRVTIGVTLGIVASKYRDIPIRYLFRSTFVKILLIFTIMLFITSARDEYLYHMIVSHIPTLFYSLVLCFVLIKNNNDFKKLVKILAWGGAIIGFFIVIEYFTNFSIGYELARTNPNFHDQVHAKVVHEYYRGGFYRPSGIAGSAVHTSYYLAFLFPLTLWYLLKSRLKFLNILPLILVVIGLIVLQTRAGAVSVFIALIFLIIEFAFLKGLNTSQKLASNFKTTLAIIMVVAFVISAFPLTRNISFGLVSQSFQSYNVSGSELSLEGKLSHRIPLALELSSQHPIIGYGSPQYVYDNVMNTLDIPLPVLMLLAGGIPLVLVYLLLLFYMPYSIFKFSKNKLLAKEQKVFLCYASAAFVAGIAVVFSSHIDSHFWIMYMLYISIYKIFYLKQSIQRKYNTRISNNGM